MKKTKIVCTIGPASADVEVLKKLMLAGMNVARINFSHGGIEEQRKFIEAVRKAREEVNLPVSLLLDTQGPEIRTGKLEEAPVTLKAGEIFTLVNEDIVGDNTKTTITYKDLYKDVKVGSVILIDDGKIEIDVKEVKGKDIICEVINGGELGNRKSINLPGTHINLPALKEKDIKDLVDGCKEDFDYIAASFIRSKDDVLAIRKVLTENGGKDIKIISKIESQEGVDNIDEIIEVSDGVMVARGDLGVEVPFEQVPILQKEFIKKCNNAGKIVITATQMLETMTSNPRPTRAEISDVANAVYDATWATMLSGESAMGKYPVQCVETMARIAEAVENDINYWKRLSKKDVSKEQENYELKIAHTVAKTAMDMEAKAIFAYTEVGDTPKILASYHPNCPIYALTTNEKTYRQLSLAWGTTPILVKEGNNADEVIENGIKQAQEMGFVQKGDIVVLAGGATALSNNQESMNRTIGGVVRI